MNKLWHFFSFIHWFGENLSKPGRLLLLAYLTVIAGIIPQKLNASEVDIKTAGLVARNLYSERQPGKTFPGIAEIITESEGGVPLFYIIRYEGKGFSIISAEDRVRPVLGYSFTSTYDPQNLAPAFEWYVIKRNRELIQAVKTQELEPEPETVAAWAKYNCDPGQFFPEYQTSVDPLLPCIWDQNWPFNALCPADPNGGGPGGHVWAGCVATAMAQVLKYWQHPWHGQGSHSYTDDNYGFQSANFGNTYYNYDSMPDTVTSYNYEVARLLYHCAVSVNMDFDTSGSVAWGWGNHDVEDALESYFYMDSGCESHVRSSYLHDTWRDMLKDDISSGQPVIYGGTDLADEAGHAWVIDGYTSDNLFHCNWGWSGNSNGFFSMDNFHANGHVYDDYEHATFNIRPKTGTLTGTLTLAGSPYVYDYDQIVPEGQTLTINPGVEVFINGRYKLVVKGKLNIPANPGIWTSFQASNTLIGIQGITFEDLNNHPADTSYLGWTSITDGKGNWDPVSQLYKGGGIFCSNSSPVVLSKVHISNCLSDYGGAIYCEPNSNIKISQLMCDNNTARRVGGGIYIDNCNIHIDESNITGNSVLADYYTPGGGGIFCNNSVLYLSNCNILDNSAQSGGGISSLISTIILDSVDISQNAASNGAGGAIYLEGPNNVTLTGCNVQQNYASDGGGAFYLSNASLTAERTIMSGNYADYGVVAAVLNNSFAEFVRTTVTRNAFGSWSPRTGILVDGSSEFRLNTSICWDNGTMEIQDDPGATLTLKYSIIENGTWNGPGILNKDPRFENPEDGNFSLVWSNFPLPDGNRSPAIESGDPSLPDDPDGTRADMGAIPYQQNYTLLPGGSLSGTLSCSESPYLITGDIEVASGDELIIEPCVNLIFKDHYALTVYGRLIADGSATKDFDENSILFAPLDTVTGWKGIRFINTNTNGQDSSRLVHCRITFGNADGWWQDDKRGGALFFSNSGDVRIEDCLINKNRAQTDGGAAYSTGSGGPLFIGNHFIANSADQGGAYYGNSSGPVTFIGNTFRDNEASDGGALAAYSSGIYLYGNSIHHNTADHFGGGIYYASGGNFIFDADNKNSVYLNYAGAAGTDLFYDSYFSSTDVVVDTFTVDVHNAHFIYPFDKFNLTHDHFVVDQVVSDLWVSDNGSDDNSGTSPLEPLKTLQMAFMKIIAKETSPRVIHLIDGKRQLSDGEKFPINCRSWVTLQGEGESNTQINGDTLVPLLYCYDDEGAIIESMQLYGGRAEKGGGVRIENCDTIKLLYVDITRCIAETSGGGLYAENSKPWFSNVWFYRDSCAANGGGATLYNCDSTKFHSVFIIDNKAIYKGGGLYSYNSYPVIESSLITSNESSHGGGLYLTGGGSLIRDCELASNSAISMASGYFGTGGAIYMYGGNNQLISNLIELNHSSDKGGGIYCFSGTNGYLLNNEFRDNTADNEGGGAYLYGSNNYRFYNCVFNSNEALSFSGGAIANYSGSPKFYNTTILSNTAGESYSGGALYNFSGNPEFHNSIIYFNSPGQIEIASGSVDISWSDIDGGWAGTGNIDVDPEIVTNYTLDETSPCIDAGNPDTTGMNLPSIDFRGAARIYNGVVDMGVSEYAPDIFTIELSLNLMLEGPFNGTTMDVSNVQIPLNQPFDTSPWNYDGTENVAAIPENVVDWVLIELRDATDAAGATIDTRTARRAAFVKSDGSVTDLDGTSPVLFDNVEVHHNIFAIVWHRNHPAIMSSGGFPPDLSITYDFTTSSGQTYQGYSGGIKQLAPGVWGLVTGDVNADGTIDENDLTLWRSTAGTNGYLPADMNMDGKVDNVDKNDFWYINQGEGTQIPD